MLDEYRSEGFFIISVSSYPPLQGLKGLRFSVAEQRTVEEASGDMSMSRTGVAHRTLDTMDAKYFQIIFFIIALIYTGLNIYNRFFTKMVITF